MFVPLIVDYLQKYFEQKFVLQETKFHVSVEDSFEWLWTAHFFETDHRKSGNLYKFILQDPGKLNSFLHILLVFVFYLIFFRMTLRLSAVYPSNITKEMCELFCLCLQHVWSSFGSSTKRVRVLWIFNYLRLEITDHGKAGMFDFLDNFGESEIPAEQFEKIVEDAQQEGASSEVNLIVSQCDHIQIV